MMRVQQLTPSKTNFQIFINRSYFSKDGLEYSLGRVPIGGTDFSTRGYTYQDNSTDASLKSFNLTEEDLIYKVRTDPIFAIW